MSDTPKTDAKAQFFGFNPDEGEEFVTASFARELERENATLRADLLIEEERSIYWRDNEGKAMAENAALWADKERMDWLENPETCCHVCIDKQPDGYSIINRKPSRGEIRAAIDAARKEAQP